VNVARAHSDGSGGNYVTCDYLSQNRMSASCVIPKGVLGL
jgi:hypothetical protein